MARNKEKAQSMLNRLITLKAEEKKKSKEWHPFLASEYYDLSEANKWHKQIIREIGRKVAEIQNEGLGEHRLRNLNDEINKLIREKSHCKRRIVELGGPNHARHSAKMTDSRATSLTSNPSGCGLGYCYFGTAKKLLGIHELFEKPPKLCKRRICYDIYKRIDASYYGYCDDEDNVLECLEGLAKEKIRREAVEEWRWLEKVRKEVRKGMKSGKVATIGGMAREILHKEEEDMVEEERIREREMRERADEKEREFVVHVPLSDEKEI